VVQGSVSPAEAQIAGENVVTATVASEVSPQEGLLLEPNPYLPTANLKVSRLWFRLYPTFGAALTGLKLGELHGLGHIPPERMAEVAQVPGVTVHTQNLARYNMLLVNVRSPLFDKAETRQAIEYAIDRDALSSESPAAGQERPAHSPMLPHSWALDPNVQARIHNVEEAKRLLDAAGWKAGPDGIRVRDGVTLTVVLAANKDVPANVAAAEQIIQDLRQVGVDAQPALVSRDVLLHDYLGPRAFHLVLAAWEAEGADPDVYAYWHSSQAVTGGLNFGGWKNDAADKALQDARTATDRDARTRAYADFQRAFAQDVPAVILSTPLYAYASREPAECRGLPETDLLTPAMRFDTINEWGLSAP
jgi:peptide/nickel transport system substrate-binding protein